MFPEITPRLSIDALLHAHTDGRAINVIAEHAYTPGPDPTDLDALADRLDEPALRYGRIHGTRVDTTVWHIALAAVPDSRELGDGECAAIAYDIAAAAGLTLADGEPTTRWVAARNTADRTLHVIASTVRRDGELLQVNHTRVNKACRDIGTRIFDQNRAPMAPPDDDSLPRVVMRDNPALGVSHAWGGDDLAERLLEHAGYRRASIASHRHVWRSPYGADLAERARLATTAHYMLSATGHSVDIEATLVAGPRTDRGVGRAQRRIDVLARLLMYCHTATDVADVTAEVAGALDSVAAFLRSLGTWTEQNLGDDAHAIELARVAELVDQAATVINRDPAHAPTPPGHPPLTRAAVAHTTTPAAPTTDTEVPTPRGPADSQARRAR